MPALAQAKCERLEVRLNAQDKSLLKEAAALSSKNVSEFLLEAGLRAATKTLCDRRLFALDDSQWLSFQEALDRPSVEKPLLRELFRRASDQHDNA